ncbi:alpha/beta hydrolase family protein [Portibacter marinus]|uniref:alpha/beta hydrolase family protein n=1 Tax=Portibacter marinus TaxID=2898660 RepID=UPI001F1CA114|nr:hypothetical protein [Portibacter marinus]
MSYTEILILILAFLLPFSLSSDAIKRNRKVIAVFLITLLIVQYVFEGVRWQLIPIYLVYLTCIFLVVKGQSFFNSGRVLKILKGGFLILILVLGFLLAFALPVFELPTPAGQYRVGAQYFVVDTNEEEYMTKEEGDNRQLIMKIWYPTTDSEGKVEPYLDEAGRKGFAKKYNLPENTFNYLNKVKTNTIQEAEIASGNFPILIFSHGYYSNAFGYYALIEEIVSQGFIVLNINHTYESVGSKFPPNDVKFFNKVYEEEHNNEEMAVMAWEATEKFNIASDHTEKREAIDNLLKNYYASEISDRWEKDIHEIVRQIPIWSETTFLTGHADISKIGVFGHSQGGSAIGKALLNNPKLSAGINIDGVQWGGMADTTLNKPFLILSSDWADDHPDFNDIAYHNSGSKDFYLAEIKGSGHSSFMDIPFMINLPVFNEAGNIDPTRAIKITSDLVVKFFNRYLNGIEADLIELPNLYPELEIHLKLKLDL